MTATARNLTGFRTAAFRADSKRLVTSNEKGEIQTWDVATGRPICSEPGRRMGANDLLSRVSFMVGGDYVLATYFRGSDEPPFIDFLDAQTCRRVGTVNFDQRIQFFFFSWDGTTIITFIPTQPKWYEEQEQWRDPLGDKPETKLWSLRGLDLRSGAPIQLSSSSLGELPGAPRGISSDGTQRLVALKDGTLQLWRPGEASPVHLERGKVAPLDLFPAAFSADGTRLAVVSGGEVRVWNTRSGKLVVAFKEDVQANWTPLMSLSSDGSKLLIACKDHTARIYPTSREGFLGAARSLLSR